MSDTSFTGTQIIRLDAVDSTNNYAAILLKETKVHEGTVILAHEQTQGKGLRGNHWFSEPGQNLTFSVVLYPKNITAQNPFVLSQVTALAVSDTLESFGISTYIKWPNDILTSKGKICGILIENQFSDQKLRHTIIGIGINVNEQMHQQSAYKATSMIEHLQQANDPELVLQRLCSFFDKWYLVMNASKFDVIHAEYLNRLLNYKKNARYRYNNQLLNATITGLDPSGKLILEKNNGECIHADFKEISFLL